MNKYVALMAVLVCGFWSPGWADAPAPKPPRKAKITWKKTIVDKIFRSEGVAVADVNKDGKLDIICGDVWYEAPGWKMHPLRKERTKDHVWNPAGYSESFAVFADDVNGDGYPDIIVLPFPGKACYWYENPKGKPELWKEHLLTNSACNETPIYIDLFKTGKRVLVMGWQPEKQNNMGEMCYFLPGKDPSQPWQRMSISGPSVKGKEVPGTQRFSHGLGHGDINGDGRIDILCTAGWWEQPEKVSEHPWKFHPANLGPLCADMYTLDVDGDGKSDVISSSAHGYGFWWHQQQAGKTGPTFVTREFFPPPPALAKEPAGFKFTKEEQALYAAINKYRAEQHRGPWRTNPLLCQAARGLAQSGPKKAEEHLDKYKGKVPVAATFSTPQEAVKALRENYPKVTAPGLEVGVGASNNGNLAVVIGDRGLFSLFGQSHALHLVDINGDGLKDLVTGRRWWAHGPKGDVSPADPAYLYWFEARRGPDGLITFIPHLIDDDSGIGTQFTVLDINGDGVPDIVISNKRGVFIFEQVRAAVAPNPLPNPGKEPRETP